MATNRYRNERHNVHITSAAAEARADRSERNQALRELEKFMRQQGLSEDDIKKNLSFYKENCLE